MAIKFPFVLRVDEGFLFFAGVVVALLPNPPPPLELALSPFLLACNSRLMLWLFNLPWCKDDGEMTNASVATEMRESKVHA